MVQDRADVFSHGGNFERIIYASPGVHEEKSVSYVHSLMEAFPHIELYESLPAFGLLGFEDTKGHSLLILDDLSKQFLMSDEYEEVMTIGSHHKVISTMHCLDIYTLYLYSITFT
jgi:hypothetical protein